MLRRSHRRPRGPLLAAGLLLATLAAACQDEPEAEPELPTEWGNGSVFGDGTLLTYAFTLSPQALAELSAGALTDKFVVADLSVTGRPLGPVGLRFKGQGCFQGGRQICDKVSFKVKLDHVEPAGQLEGVTQLNLNAPQEDPSQLRERLAARMFAAMELIGPRVSHAFVTINGQRRGLFTVVEEIDERFTRDRWNQAGAGNLYREAWPTEADPEAYDAHLQTNRAVKDHRRIAAFGQAMRTALAGDPLRAALERFARIEYLLRFLALDQVIKNEGLTTFYCEPLGGACGNSNYYWYETATGPLVTESQFWLLPWELGNSFRLQSPLDQVPTWDKPPADCNARIMVEDARVMPAGCDVVFRALLTAGRPAYVKALDRLLAEWKVPELGGDLDAWAAQIEVATRLDPVGPGSAGFRGGVQALKRDLQAFRERIEALRADVAVVPFGLTAPGVTDFEEVATLPFVLGVSSEGNARSGVVPHLNGTGALAGSTDLRFDFELADDLDPRGGALADSQFALLRLPLAGPAPLPGLLRIRLRARADAIRNVRIELDSDVQRDDPESPRYGWDVLLAPQAMDLTLDAAKLALPAGASPTAAPSLDSVLAGVVGLTIVPEARGRKDGIYGSGRSDPGFVQLDDVRIEAP